MTFLIGDLHGCYHSLLSLLDKIPSDSPLVFVGDYCDRGKYTKEVVDTIIRLGERATCLRGNHDDVLDWLVNGHSMSHPSEWVTGSPTEEKVINWMLGQPGCNGNGLSDTLASYGVKEPYRVSEMYGHQHIDADRILSELREGMGEPHQHFFRKLKMYWENDTHFAWHAFFNPTDELPLSMKFVKEDKFDSVLWDRFCRQSPTAIHYLTTSWDKIGVFGHTPTFYHYDDQSISEPVSVDKVRLIDCGCFTGRKLAAYCVEEDSFLTVDADPRDLLEKYKG